MTPIILTRVRGSKIYINWDNVAYFEENFKAKLRQPYYNTDVCLINGDILVVSELVETIRDILLAMRDAASTRLVKKL